MSQRCTDLKKVTHVTLHYRNQTGVILSKKPRKPSVNGQVIDKDALLYRGNGEGLLSYAKRRGLLDTWVPIVRLYCSMARILTYEGDRARAIWKDWNARVYKDKKVFTKPIG